jgi:hypothetical protein
MQTKNQVECNQDSQPPRLEEDRVDLNQEHHFPFRVAELTRLVAD